MEETKSRKGKTGLMLAVIAIIGFGGFTGINCLKYKQEKTDEKFVEQSMPVELSRARIESLEWKLLQTGNIKPLRSVKVFSKIPGKIIEKIYVEKGAIVKKGDPIATLERDVIDAQLNEARAGIASAKANLGQVAANLSVLSGDKIRMENLYREKAIARQKLDHLHAQYKAMEENQNLAHAQIKRAEAIVKQLKVLSQNHIIVAPVDGIVVNRFVDPGSMSSQGIPLVQIADESRVKIITTVTEKYFPHVRSGMRANIRIDAFPDKEFEGVVSLISPFLDPATRTGEIEIHISNNDGYLKAGMFARVKMFLGHRKKLVVLAEALNQIPGTGDYFIYTVDKNRAVMKNVVTGISQGLFVEIKEGIIENEPVVVKGQSRLKDNAMVTVVSEKAAGTAGNS